MSEHTLQDRKTARRDDYELMLEHWREFLRDEYREVCKSHADITDFRAKLLALLPVASGTGIGLLVVEAKTNVSDVPPGLLIGLGVFGVFVTVGLFLYELRQIDVCKQLRNRGAYIENQFGERAGQFGGRRDRLSLQDVYRPSSERDDHLGSAERTGKNARWPERGPAADSDQRGRSIRVRLLDLRKTPFVGAETAGYVVYLSVLLAWAAVAALGVWRV